MRPVKTAVSMIIVFFALISLGAGNGPDEKPEKMTRISFEKAIQNPDLLKAMVLQVEDDFLAKKKATYTCSVRHDQKTYSITGTYEQWDRILKIKWKGSRLANSFCSNLNR